MPAPAVYVIAIIGTVGAAIAFKEFVYDPHLGPAIGRWKQGFFAAREERRRKRAAMLESAQEMNQRRSSALATDNSFQEDNNSAQPAWGSQPAKPSFSNDGLLIGRSGSIDGAHSSIELDNLVARELREWRNEVTASSGQDLRQRKTGSGHGAMDESIHSIPYSPLSPRRTHVLFNSGSVSPATPSNAIQPLLTPATPPMTPIGINAGKPQASRQSPPQTLASPSRARSPSSFSGSITGSHSPLLLRSPLQGQPAPEIQIHPYANAGSQDKPLPPISNVHSSLFSPLLYLSPTQSLLPPQAVSPQLQTSPYSQHIPSLSQSYPQEIDAEHGLELVSPPSSRADSPFLMADVSPGPRSLSTILDGPTSVLSTGFVQNNSLSPLASLRMDLGNESFDTLSPLMSHLQPMSNFQVTNLNTTSGSGPPAYTSLTEPLHLQAAAPPQSVTNSARSTTYLSFTGGDDDDDDDVPLAVRRASLSSAGSVSQSQGLGLTFVVPSPRTAPAVRSPPRSPLDLNDSDLSDLDLMSDYAPSEAGFVSIESLSGSENEMAVGHRDETRSRILHPSATGYESDDESNASWSVAGESDVSGTG